jgi:quinol monooxygenase YgiN
MTLGVLATLQVADEAVDAVAAALAALAAAAADEPGTELFAVHVAADRPGHFVVFERYSDQAAVDAHRGSTAMAEFRAALRATGTKPEIVFLTPLVAS